MKARFNYRLHPHPGQAHSLFRAFGCARVVWNDALAYCQQTRQQGGKTPSGYDLKKIVVTQAKKDPSRAWLAEVSSVVLNESVLDLGVAFQNFFASVTGKRKGPRVNPPRFKQRRGKQAIRLTRGNFKVREHTLTIPKVGRIPITWSRPLPSTPSSVTILKDASGRYFASFVCEVDPQSLSDGAESVGVDLGIATFATLSTGEKMDAPKPLKKRLNNCFCLHKPNPRPLRPGRMSNDL